MILSGSEPRVRNMALVESAYARPKNRAAYDDAATLFDITAELAYGLASNHGFVDGNKRAAFAAAFMTLWMNGYRPDFTIRDAIATFDALAGGERSVDQLAQWFEANAIKQ